MVFPPIIPSCSDTVSEVKGNCGKGLDWSLCGRVQALISVGEEGKLSTLFSSGINYSYHTSRLHCWGHQGEGTVVLCTMPACGMSSQKKIMNSNSTEAAQQLSEKPGLYKKTKSHIQTDRRVIVDPKNTNDPRKNKLNTRTSCTTDVLEDKTTQ